MKFDKKYHSKGILFIWEIFLSQYFSHVNTRPLNIDSVKIYFNTNRVLSSPYFEFPSKIVFSTLILFNAQSLFQSSAGQQSDPI